MRTTADIGIVGAGPAGARAAELLGRGGADVIVPDPKTPWEKPCGGGLTPPAFEEFPELHELASEAREIDRVRVELAPERGFTVDLRRPVRILSRRTLARWQLERARAAGARHLPVKVRSAKRSGGGWVLDTDDCALRVSLLIGADGAASVVRRVATPKFSVALAPTRVAYPLGPGPTPDTLVLKFYGAIAGYLWDFPRPGHRSIGIGVANGSWKRPVLDSEIDAHRESSHACHCEDVERGGAVIGTAQLGHGDFSALAGRDFALLGDAAGFADPLTGEGIRNALRSARLLASAWEAGDVRRGYPELARRAFSREFSVARMVRHLVVEGDVGLRLIEKGGTSDVAYASVAAAINVLNDHDGSVTRVVHEALRVLRRVRVDPAMARRTARVAVPCRCDSPEGEPTPDTASRTAERTAP